MVKSVTCVAFVATLFSLANLYGFSESFVFVGYYGTWATYRHGNGQFNTENIDPTLFTHLVYAFAALDGTSYQIKAFDPWLDLPDNGGRNNYGHFVNLTKRNPSVRPLLAIGGWNEGSTKYSDMVSTPERRTNFVTTAAAFIKKYRFHGLDFDWEYPGLRGGRPEDKQNFVLLLKELREEFDKFGLLLTIAIGAGKDKLDTSYDIPAISKYVHLVNVMTYDFHGSWEHETGIVAPLFASPEDTLENQQLTVNFSINYLLELGAPKDKLVMGMPIYGNTFTLADPNDNGIYAPATGPGLPGPYTNQPGFLGYNEICEKFKKEQWTVKREEVQRVPYAFSGNQWVGFEDPKSVAEKVEYLQSKNLRGAMVWSVETDDFRSVCGPKNVILKTIYDGLHNDVTTSEGTTSSDFTTPEFTTSSGETTASEETTSTEFTTPEPTTTTIPSYVYDRCPEGKLIEDIGDCGYYYQCVAASDEGGGWIVYHKNCPYGLAFSFEEQVCDYPYKVPGCEDYYPPSTTTTTKSYSGKLRKYVDYIKKKINY